MGGGVIKIKPRTPKNQKEKTENNNFFLKNS
jgi:hypothetical protein